MHRATPSNSSFRSYAAGGAGSVVDEVDDKKLIQEMKGNFMKGESRSKVEAPQNYGFSSVTADADKPEAKQGGGGAGQGEGPSGGMGAEAHISFAGGNRSFPVATVIDDRRHRLKELEKGDVAMFGQRDWGQQFHLNKDGMFMTGNKDKRVKIQLVTNEQESDREGGQGGGKSAGAADASGGQGGQQQQGQKKAKGQKKLYDKQSEDYLDITKDKIEMKRGPAITEQTGGYTMGYHTEKDHSYRADKEHTHIRHKNNVWVDKTGCFSSCPIIVKPCQDND